MSTARPEPFRANRLRDLTVGQRLWAGGALAGLLAFAGANVAARAREGYTPLEAIALISLRASTVFTDWPLVGQLNSSRQFGGPVTYQPGPMLFYLAHPFVATLGAGLGLLVFATTINVAAVGLGTVAAYRTRQAMGAVLVAGASLWMFAVALPGEFTSARNGPLMVLPMFCTFVLALAILDGDTVWFAPQIAVASFVVQGNLAYAVPALAACALGAVVVAFRAWRRVGRALRHLAIGGGTLVVLWLPAVIDQIWGIGNMGALARTRLTGRGLRGSNEALGSMFNPSTSLLQRHILAVNELRPLAGSAILTVAAIAAMIFWARQRGYLDVRPLVVAAVVVAAAVVAGYLGPAANVEPGHFYWVKASAVFVWFAIALAVLPSDLLLRVQRRPRLGLAWGSLAAVVLLAGLATDTRPATPMEREMYRQVDDLVGQVVAHTDEGRFGVDALCPCLDLVSGGVLPRLPQTGRNLALAVDARPPDGTLLVVYGTRRPGAGRLVASIGRSHIPEIREIDAQVRAWAQAAGPLHLTEPGRFVTRWWLSGTGPPSLDPYDSERCGPPGAKVQGEDQPLPDGLLPYVVAAGGVTQEIPPTIQAVLQRWMQIQPVSVYLVPSKRARPPSRVAWCG